MIEIATFFTSNSQTIDHLTKAFNSIATVIALAVGGVWTFRLFIKNRLNKPRAHITHEVEVRNLGELGIFVHASIKINNQSSVLMKIICGEVRLVPMLPLPREIVEALREKKSPLHADDTEIAWPKRQSIKFEWSNNPREIEPSETDTFHFDFIVEKPLATFQIYSYFKNFTKPQREIGWNTTTIHDVIENQ